jgi:hypothetical protein
MTTTTTRRVRTVYSPGEALEALRENVDDLKAPKGAQEWTRAQIADDLGDVLTALEQHVAAMPEYMAGQPVDDLEAALLSLHEQAHGDSIAMRLCPHFPCNDLDLAKHLTGPAPRVLPIGSQK